MDVDYNDSMSRNWEIFKAKWDIPPDTPLDSVYTVTPPKYGFDPTEHFFAIDGNDSNIESTELMTGYSNKGSNGTVNALSIGDDTKVDQHEVINPNRQGGNAVKPYEEIYRSIQPLLDGSNPENAISALQNLVQSFPDFAKAHNDLGVLYYQSGEMDNALKHYEQAVHAEPHNSVFQKNLADFYYAEQGRVEDALKIYGDILAITPEDTEILQICGHLCVSLHRFEDAETYYKRLLEKEPWHSEIKEILDKLQSRIQDSAKDQTPEEIYQEIMSTSDGSDSQKTIEALERLSAAAPEFAPAHNDLGVLYFQTGEKEKSLSHYEQAARLEPANITFKKNLADFYYIEQGRVEDALQIYVDLLAINPQDIETLQVCGHICIALYKFDDARVFYNRVLELEPWNADARELLDKIDNQGQPTPDADTPDEVYQQIQSEMDGMDPQAVIEALEKLASSAPEFAPAHNDLGVLYYQTGDKQKALDHYEQAARLEPGNITFKKNLADFYYVEQGRVEDALTIYVDVLAISPEDIETLLITGHICVALHKFEDAKVFYNRVLEIEPWNAETRDYLEQLQLKEKAV